MRRIVYSLFCLSMWFNTIAQPAITPISLPAFMQGSGQADPAFERKVPFAARMRITGLTPNATYRYITRFTDSEISGNNGFGNCIFTNKTGGNFRTATAVSFANPANYAEFTADGTGAVEEWFLGTASIDIRFFPGSTVYLRVILNNGAGGTSVGSRLTASLPITTINFGNANNATSGTGLRTTAIPSFNPKDIVMLFDNEAGTGRPVAGTYVESDGQLQDANPADPYAPFYANDVDGQANRFGTIIPNVLPNGIRNISSYSLIDGSLLIASKRADALWPTIPSGTVSTINPTSGLTALVISGADLVLPVKLLSFKAVCQDKPNMVKLEWKTESETNFSSFEVQQSIDGVQFEAIQNQKAKGAQTLYELSLAGTVKAKYFRLKMIDNDGKFSYSKVVKVNCNQTSKFSAFPNPAFSAISVNHESGKVGESLHILSMSGSVLQSKNLVKGSIQTKFDLSALMPGNYIILLKNNDEISNQIQFTKL